MEKKRNKKQKLHIGKSYGICKVCGREFKLKHKTKHNHTKKPKGICSQCGINEVRKDGKIYTD